MQLLWEITVGQIFTSLVSLGAFLAGVAAFFYALKSSIQEISLKADASSNLIAERMQTLGGRIINLETDVKELNKVIISMAESNVRLDSIDARINNHIEEYSQWKSWVRGQLRDCLDEMRGRTRYQQQERPK